MTTGNPLSVAMMTITFFVDMNIDIDFRVFIIGQWFPQAELKGLKVLPPHGAWVTEATVPGVYRN